MHEESPSLEIHFPSFGNDTTLRLTSRPESMPHGTPWVFWIGAKIAVPILSDVESRRRPRDCQIHDAGFIRGRLDRV